jgi:hypothetical protein
MLALMVAAPGRRRCSRTRRSFCRRLCSLCVNGGHASLHRVQWFGTRYRMCSRATHRHVTGFVAAAVLLLLLLLPDSYRADHDSDSQRQLELELESDPERHSMSLSKFAQCFTQFVCCNCYESGADKIDCTFSTNFQHQKGSGTAHCAECDVSALSGRRKGRQDSHTRVHTIQTGRGPGGWTHRRGWNVAGAPSRGISYPISTKSLISKPSISLYPDIAPITCTISKFYLRYPYIPLILQYDIVPDVESKPRYRIHIECTKSVEIEYRTRYRRFSFDIETTPSVQRASFWSVFNIVPDIVRYRCKYII